MAQKISMRVYVLSFRTNKFGHAKASGTISLPLFLDLIAWLCY